MEIHNTAVSKIKYEKGRVVQTVFGGVERGSGKKLIVSRIKTTAEGTATSADLQPLLHQLRLEAAKLCSPPGQKERQQDRVTVENFQKKKTMTEQPKLTADAYSSWRRYVVYK